MIIYPFSFVHLVWDLDCGAGFLIVDIYGVRVVWYLVRGGGIGNTRSTVCSQI